MKDVLLETLSKRLTELEAFRSVYQKHVEPDKYPRGLFKAQTHPHKRYNLSAYIDEMCESLKRLDGMPSSPIYERLAHLVLQQISVLTLSLKSQKKRVEKGTSFQALLKSMHDKEVNAFEFFCDAEKRTQIDILSDNLKQKKTRVGVLENILQNKKKQFSSELDKLKHSQLKRECDSLLKEHLALKNEIESDMRRIEALKS